MRYFLLFILIIPICAVAQPIAITRPVAGLANSNNNTIYTMAQFAPAQNALLVLIVAAATTVLTDPTVINSTGTAMTWTLEASSVIAGNGYYIFWTKTGNVTGNIAVRFSCVGDAAQGIKMSLHQVIGYNNTIANPIRQTIITGESSSANPTITFDRALRPSNAYIVGWVGNVNNTSSTPPTGWAESDDISHNAPNFKLSTARLATGLSTNDPISFTNASTTWVGIGIEIRKRRSSMPLYMFSP